MMNIFRRNVESGRNLSNLNTRYCACTSNAMLDMKGLEYMFVCWSRILCGEKHSYDDDMSRVGNTPDV